MRIPVGMVMLVHGFFQQKIYHKILVVKELLVLKMQVGVIALI